MYKRIPFRFVPSFYLSTKKQMIMFRSYRMIYVLTVSYFENKSLIQEDVGI